MKNRQEDNLEIHAIVGDYILEHPELRYIQALWALGIVDAEDRFYEEPPKTLERMKDREWEENEV